MGITLGFSRHQDAADWFSRGIHLLTIGLVLNVLRYGPFAFTAYATGDPELLKSMAQIFNVDILQFAGLSFMLLALCKKMKMNVYGILALSVAMNIIGTLLIGCNTSNYVVNQILGYLYHTPTCSCFTLFNWFIFIAAGNVLGVFYKESDYIDKVYRYIIPVCGVIAFVHQYLSITGGAPFFKTLQNDWEFYSMATPDALCIAFGVIPFMIGIFYLISKIIPENLLGILSYPSKHLLQFFCVSWVWIMWIHCFLYFISPATTLAAFVFVWVFIGVLTTITVVFYNRHLEHLVSPFFKRHTTAWYIGTWGSAIVFGIFYFTNVPEPYIMPY